MLFLEKIDFSFPPVFLFKFDLVTDGLVGYPSLFVPDTVPMKSLVKSLSSLFYLLSPPVSAGVTAKRFSAAAVVLRQTACFLSLSFSLSFYLPFSLYLYPFFLSLLISFSLCFSLSFSPVISLLLRSVTQVLSLLQDALCKQLRCLCYTLLPSSCILLTTADERMRMEKKGERENEINPPTTTIKQHKASSAMSANRHAQDP